MSDQPMATVWRPFLALALCVMLVSCSGPTTPSSAEPSSPVTTPAPGSESPLPLNQLPRLNGKATVVITVKGQPITIEVDGANAPISSGNFVDLVQRGFYDGTLFHRVVPGFVAQGGDPFSKVENPPGPVGTGGFADPQTGKPRDIPLEIWPEGASEPVYSKTLKSAGVTQPPKLKHVRGAVAMARSMLPDSASSQFYIALDDGGTANLNGDYAVFGTVTQGMDVVDSIQQGDKIDTAKVTQGSENLQKQK
jgi:peptidyl-prolyl cis-trans isomerase B (cyclophilin B)